MSMPGHYDDDGYWQQESERDLPPDGEWYSAKHDKREADQPQEEQTKENHDH